MEAQFLESQSARVKALKERVIGRRADGALEGDGVAAEALLQSRFGAWQALLNDLQKVVDPPLLENDKRDTKLKFDQMQEALDSLRREVSLNDALSDASLQRWHKLLVEAQGHLDKLQTKLLPKGKFVFRRYRQALLNKQKMDYNNKSNSPPRAEKISNNDSSDFMNDGISSLQDLSNEFIDIDENNIQRRSEDTNEIWSITSSSDSVPLVWRRLNGCNLTWSASDVSQTEGSVLYLVELKSCKIIVNIDLSSIHVTECQDIILQVKQTQQIRLHASVGIRVWGRITGGTILEGCHKIGVTTNCPSVQDFSWLKVGVPSPNFERLSEETNLSVTKPVNGLAEPATLSVNTAATFERTAPFRTKQEKRGEDDDEL